jgi:hypothetical protein
VIHINEISLFQNQFAPHLSQEAENSKTDNMTTNNNSNNDNNPRQPIEERCLQLSSELDKEIANLRSSPHFRETGDDLDGAEQTFAILKHLKQTRPELFNPENPADGLAMLYAGMD